jgi:hypothetical protein
MLVLPAPINPTKATVWRKCKLLILILMLRSALKRSSRTDRLPAVGHQSNLAQGQNSKPAQQKWRESCLLPSAS